MINFILTWWFKIPHIKFRNPFIINKRDKRELEWFKERRRYGFDERILWCLNDAINEKVMTGLGIDISKLDYHDQTRWCTTAQFKKWFTICSKNDLKWIYDRVERYLDWNCPTFFIKPGAFQDKGSLYLSNEESKLILQECLIILNNRINNETKPGDAEYIEAYLFTLGW